MKRIIPIPEAGEFTKHDILRLKDRMDESGIYPMPFVSISVPTGDPVNCELAIETDNKSIGDTELKQAFLHALLSEFENALEELELKKLNESLNKKDLPW